MELNQLSALVVEDNHNALKMLVMMLEDMGIDQICTARDGREAQKFLDDSIEGVDVILCDWRMPNMNGLELLQQVRMTYPNILFVMITANNDVASVKAAKEFGVNAYLSKPYTPEQLEGKLRSMLAQL